MKGVPIFSTKASRSVCAVCKFGTKDGVTLFNTPGDRAWACAKHLRFVSSKPIDPEGQRIVDGLADGSIQ